MCVFYGLVLSFSGCSRTITVISKQKANIRVDLVAVNKSMKSYWQSLSMTEYWETNPKAKSEDSKPRTQADAGKYLHSFRFGEGFKSEYVLAEKNMDPIWKTWKETGAEYLFILADLVPPDGKPFIDMHGNGDPRRKCIPLSSECWTNGQIEIEITDTGVRIPFAPKNKRQCQCE